MKIYACQMTVVPGQPDVNLETMKKFVLQAKAVGADLAVFPEMCLPGYLISDAWEEA